MRYSSCDRPIEESDVQFYLCCGGQIRASSAGKPTQHVGAVINTPTLAPS